MQKPNTSLCSGLAFGRPIATIVVGAGVLCASSLAQGPNAVSFGPNVIIFNPSMPTSQIQATVDAISTQQVSNQFGAQRYALLFEPGVYGSAATPSPSR
jgi:hypothetical protein